MGLWLCTNTLTKSGFIHTMGALDVKSRAPLETTEMACLLLDRELIAQIKLIEHATGQHGMLSEFVRRLEGNLAAFGAALPDYIARGDTAGATLAAHTLKGICLQLGALELGDLFAEIERSVQADNYAEAKRTFEGGADLIAQSLEALKHA
jgi:HPt (histidine-containing phosphotransfer) domain-containing protein